MHSRTMRCASSREISRAMPYVDEVVGDAVEREAHLLRRVAGLPQVAHLGAAVTAADGDARGAVDAGAHPVPGENLGGNDLAQHRLVREHPRKGRVSHALLQEEVALDLAVLVVEPGQELRVELPVGAHQGELDETKHGRREQIALGSPPRGRHRPCPFPRQTRGRPALPPGPFPRSPPRARPGRLAAAGGPGDEPPPPSRWPRGSRRGCRRGRRRGRTVRVGVPGWHTSHPRCPTGCLSLGRR